MSHPISLAFLTVGNISPVETVLIAARNGYTAVGLRMLPAAPNENPYPLLVDDHLLRETKAALVDTGITVGDVEIVRLKETTDIIEFDRFLDRAAELGAKNILVAGDDPNLDRLGDTFAAFCRAAKSRGLTGDLEFMPWTAVKNIADARKVIEKIDQDNGGILIDALHFGRSKSTLDEIRNLPQSYIHYAQLCDGPVPYDPSDEGLIKIARAERLMPGEGGIDVVSIIKALPDDTAISLEVADLKLQTTEGPNVCAARAIASAKRVLEQAGRSAR